MKPNKYTLKLRQVFPFAQNGPFCEVSADKISANDALLPAAIDPAAAFNPRNLRLWAIGHEFGGICAVWASGPHDALDSAVDAGFLDCLQIQEADADDDTTRLGNAGEPFDLTYAWCAEVEIDAARDIQLIVAMVRANESGANTLGD